MGKYTVLKDPKVDEYIDCCLVRIVDVLVQNLPDIDSIMLTGSFGKGQGSVYVDGATIRPQRDIDLVIIFRKKIPAHSLISNIQEKLQTEMGSLSSSKDYYLMGNLLPEIKATTLSNINSLPDIVTYDLKKCQVIYGLDLRSKIKWELCDLPLRTNARALFQKGIALIGAFCSEYLHEEIPTSLKDSFLRETSRAYIEICVGLCLLAERYHWSCTERLDTLKEIYNDQFKDLSAKIPDLVEKIEISTKYKLDPANNPINVKPLDYWFQTRDDLGEVIKFYFKEYLNIDFDNWIQFSNYLEKNLTKNYYLPIIDAFLTNRNFPNNSCVLTFLNLLFNMNENIQYSWVCIKDGYLSLPLVKNVSSPAIKALTVVPLLLFAITSDLKINSEYVQTVLKRIGFVRSDFTKSGDSWDEARSKLLKLVFSVNLI